MASKTPTLLCILDGIGLNPNPEANAVAQAKTPNLDALLESYPSTTLTTFGEAVGLPEGQMGNSEVGHIHIGAGRLVPQWLLRVSNSLKESSFLEASAEFQNFQSATVESGKIHLIGLLSDGGVHSHKDHLYLLLQQLLKKTKAPIALHLITDGRDTDPKQALDALRDLEKFIRDYPQMEIATISGRFYTMDRDNRWERTEKAYSAIALGEGPKAHRASEWIENSYDSNTTDEFIEPAVINASEINAEDGVIFWNFRTDRMRQIVSALCETKVADSFSGFKIRHSRVKAANTLCFTNYDATFGLPYLFAPIEIKNFLGEVVASADLKQLRTAETEKYPHVTYFLNGGSEKILPGEVRELVPSARDVKTYDEKPEMSAHGVCQIVCEGIGSGKYSLIVANFANGDMVGHTGCLKAATKAVEVVDECLGKILAELKAAGGNGVIIADHGNCEQMIDYKTGSPHTSHTTFPVPMAVVGTSASTSLKANGNLQNIAPTVLELMNLDCPLEMSADSLLVSN